MTSYEWPPTGGGGIVVYANFAAFPASAPNGTIAKDGGAHILYEYNSTTVMWEPIASNAAYLDALASAGSPAVVGTIDSEVTPSPNGATIAGGALIMQSASATVPGLVNNTTQTFSGAKTLTSTLTGTAANFSGAISASNFSGSSSGTNTGDVTLTAVGSTPSANGASLVGQALTLQPADGTHPGVLTEIAQSIGGDKTFNSNVGIGVAPGTAALRVKNTAGGDGTGLLLESDTGMLWDFAAEASSLYIIKGSNVYLHLLTNGYTGFGPAVPKYNWDFNVNDPMTNPALIVPNSGTNNIPSVIVRNPNATAGAFAGLTFAGNSGNPTGGVYAIASTQTSGSEVSNLQFFTQNAGVYTKWMTLGSTGIVTANSYGAGVAQFSSAGVISSTAPGTSGNVLTSNGTAWVSSAAASGGLLYSNLRYVSPVSGNDATGDGSYNKPFATVGACLAAITTASTTNRFSIHLMNGNYSGEGTITWKDWVSADGEDREAVRGLTISHTSTVSTTNTFNNFTATAMTLLATSGAGINALIQNCTLGAFDAGDGTNAVSASFIGSSVTGTATFAENSAFGSTYNSQFNNFNQGGGGGGEFFGCRFTSLNLSGNCSAELRACYVTSGLSTTTDGTGTPYLRIDPTTAGLSGSAIGVDVSQAVVEFLGESVVHVTATYNFDDGNLPSVITAAPGAGTLTINLPPAADYLGRPLTIKKTGVGAGAVSVVRNGTDTIDGAASNITISTANGGKTIIANPDGSGWWIISTIAVTPVAIADGGTGATTKAAAFDTLSPMNAGGQLIYGGTSGTGTALANGSAGQLLQSNGTTLAPSWVAPPLAPVAPTVQNFTSGTSATYTTPTSPRSPLYLKVTIIGGGGGGGAAGATSGGEAGGGGGGGGGTVIHQIASPSATYTYTVGGAGAGGVSGGAAATDGGASSFNSISAGGGVKGAPSTGINAEGAGGAGGAASGGSLDNVAGQYGAAGGFGVSAVVAGTGGTGGSSLRGFGGTATPGAAQAGVGHGAGGSGGTQSNGGAGTAGVIIVEEYYQ